MTVSVLDVFDDPTERDKLVSVLFPDKSVTVKVSACVPSLRYKYSSSTPSSLGEAVVGKTPSRELSQL